MKRYYIFLIFIYVAVGTIDAQNIENKVSNEIFKAEAAYKDSNYSSAINYLGEAKNITGETSLKIQFLYIKTYVAMKNWQDSKIEITKYYNLHPSVDAADYSFIKNIEQQVNEQIEMEDNLYKKATQNNDIDMMNGYLFDYPFGKYVFQIRNTLQEIKGDESAWQIAKNKSNTKAYYNYINLYPQGMHTQEAKITIDLWDKKAYKKAIESNTQNSLKNYLNNYSNGNYRDEINKKLAIKQEDDLFQQAVSSRNISDFENYLDNYPEGTYSSNVKKILKNQYIVQAKKAENENYWKTSKYYYQKYINRFPNGANASKARRGIKKSERKESQNRSIYFSYVYEKNASIGLSLGALKTKGLGFYTHIRLNSKYIEHFNSLRTITDAGNSSSPWNLSPLNEFAYGNFKISTGYSWKLVYPFWLHGGLGFALQPVYQNVNELDNYGQLLDTVWMKRTDLSLTQLFWETGVDFKLGSSWLLKVGLEHINSINIYQFGLGFTL